MSYEFYRVLHFSGIFAVLMSLGTIAVLARSSGSKKFAERKFLSITHGVGLVVSLVAGFGLLARLGLFGAGGWPLWVWGKLGIWLVFGAYTMAIYKSPKRGAAWWVGAWALAVVAAYLARYKIG
jgi:hypothetical protein